MKKIRILVDARVIGGEGQGSATYVKGLYNALHRMHGASYEFFFASYEYDSLKEAFPFIEKKNFISVKSTGRFQLYFFEFPSIIEEYRIDFAHFQYNIPFRKNCKFIVTVHDVLFNDFPEEFSNLYRLQRNYIFKRALNQSEIKLTVSEYSREMIAKSYDLTPSDIFITPNAVDQRFVRPYDTTEVQTSIYKKFSTKNFILFVSRIEPRKNHALLIEAFHKLELYKEGKELVLIGNDTLDSKIIENTLAKLPSDCQSRIHWIKYVSDEDLIDFYRACRLFVYPSKAEGFGIPPIEAAAMCKNTLCSNTTSMRDFDFFGDNHFSPEDKDVFFKLLRNNLDKPPTQKQLEEISKIIKVEYSWKQGAGLIHQQVHKCLGVFAQKVR